MSEQQKLSVSYGSFSCEIVGFQDPLPVLQDVIGEFRQIAWRYPGFGAQNGDAQRDRLSKLVASKLNAAPTANGVAVTINQENGGLLAHPVDGAPKGEGWGDLYAKPKSGEAPKKSGEKHAAAAAATEAVAAVAAEAPAEISPDAPAEAIVEPEPEIVPTPIVEPAEEVRAEAAAEAPAEESSAPEIDEAPEEKIAEIASAPELVAEEKHAEPAETPEATPAEDAAADEKEPIAAAPLDDAPADAPEETAAPEDEGLIAAQIHDEIAAVVNTEIKDAFADLHHEASPAESPAAVKRAGEEASHKSGLFSRFLGGKKKPAQSEADESAATAPLHMTGRNAEAGASQPERTRGGETALDAAFNSIAEQSGASAKADDIGKDFVFAGADMDKPADDPALVLSSENAVDPSEVDEHDGAEERVAKAKARVMERARERQAAQHAATERRLRIIRRERVEEKGDEMTDAVANAATGAPAMSAADFAKLAGAASLQELMEASAAYATLVGGKHKFTRNDLMDVMSELDKSKTYSPEALIKSFGKMLRTGVLLRVDDGLFAMSQNHRYPYETKIHA
jgi:hypothetical protein